VLKEVIPPKEGTSYVVPVNGRDFGSDLIMGQLQGQASVIRYFLHTALYAYFFTDEEGREVGVIKPSKSHQSGNMGNIGENAT